MRADFFDLAVRSRHKCTWVAAQKINGISPEDVYGLNTFSDILSEVILILSSYDNVIAYNVAFEKQFIEAYIKRDEEFYLGEYDINWRFDLDPMEMYKNYVGSNKWIKLETAANSFGYQFKAHDSLEDAKATLFLFKKIIETK